MRDMALADLQAVAERLRALHDRLNQQTGKTWGQQEVAQEAGVAYRSFQTWEGGHNENTNGKGYEKLAAFYRRKLGDRSITRNWIVFGDHEDTSEPAPSTDDLSQLDRIEALLVGIFTRLPDAETALDEDLEESLRQARERVAAAGRTSPATQPKDR